MPVIKIHITYTLISKLLRYILVQIIIEIEIVLELKM
jgi:hypothetical protein